MQIGGTSRFRSKIKMIDRVDHFWWWRERERDGVVVVKIRWKEPSAGGGLIVALVLERAKKGEEKRARSMIYVNILSIYNH